MNKLIVLSIVPTSIAPRGPADVLSDPHRTGAERAVELIERATSPNTRRTYATA